MRKILLAVVSESYMCEHKFDEIRGCLEAACSVCTHLCMYRLKHWVCALNTDPESMPLTFPVFWKSSLTWKGPVHTNLYFTFMFCTRLVGTINLLICTKNCAILKSKKPRAWYPKVYSSYQMHQDKMSPINTNKIWICIFVKKKISLPVMRRQIFTDFKLFYS